MRGFFGTVSKTVAKQGSPYKLAAFKNAVQKVELGTDVDIPGFYNSVSVSI